jgi:hypothetical protein
MLQRTRARWRAAPWMLAAFVAAGCVTRRVPATIYPVVPLRTEALPEATGATDADRFGALFCGVLHYHRPDPGEWSYCEQYFKPTGTALRPSEDIPFISAYRVLVVPGIFGQCVERYARPFGDAIDHLASTHKIPVEYLSVTAMGSSGYNARQIAEYLDRQFAGADKRPYIVVGYSKGAPDALEALAQFPAAQREIAAIVTVAGAVLGSRLSEGVPPGVMDMLRSAKLGPCEAGDGGGVESLRRDVRARAMARFHLPEGTRAYSIAAVSDEAGTRPALVRGWRTLQAFSLEQDSQVIHEDAIVPGGTYLGIAGGDHWAVALPFERIRPTDPSAKLVRRFIGFRDYPRAALFEAILRFVAEDLHAHAPR